MKKIAVALTTWAMATLLVLPMAAYAWPEPLEEFADALQRDDVEAAVSVFTDDAFVVIPSAFLSPRLKLDFGFASDDRSSKLAGKKQIRAWLEEFLIQENGVLVMNGPAEMEGTSITTSHAAYWDDNTRRIDQSGVLATVDIELQGDKIKEFWLKPRGDLLTKLEAANVQASSQNRQGGGQGDEQDISNAALTAPEEGSGAKATVDFGEYAWVVPGAAAALAAVVVLGFRLPRRRQSHKGS